MNTKTHSISLDEQVCFSLYTASNALIRAYKPILSSLDLTYLQYMTMIVLWEHAPLNVKEVGNKLHLDSGTLTPLIKRLVDKGYVSKQRSTLDERIVEVNLTEVGRELESQGAHVPGQLMCNVDMSVEQAKQLKQLTDLLYVQLSSE